MSSAFNTIDDAVDSAEDLVLVVPSSDSLGVEVPSSDSDRRVVRRQSVLRFTAFRQRTPLEVKGTVTGVSPRDSESGPFDDGARTAPDATYVELVGGHKLIAAGCVDSLIEASPRTALSYRVNSLTAAMPSMCDSGD